MTDISFDFTIPWTEGPCAHLSLHVEGEHTILEYCPKGCDGTPLFDLTITCKDCGQIIHEVHSGHEDCKYGR